MNTTRVGKIGRLPKAVRDVLGDRLEGGDSNIEQFAEMKMMLVAMRADMADDGVKAPNSTHQAPENIQAPTSKRRRAGPSPRSQSRWPAMPMPGR